VGTSFTNVIYSKIQIFYNKGHVSSKDDDITEYRFVRKPNIYYILIDAYARQDTLQETLNYNNEPFLQKLESLGFVVSRKAFSNYHFTGASLSATMIMNYHMEDKNGHIQYGKMHTSLQGVNSVRKTFSLNGYHIINIPAHWHQMDCYGFEHTCIKQRGYEIFQSFISDTPFKIFKLPNRYVEPDVIKLALSVERKEPIFVFAHLAQVHDAIHADGKKSIHVKHPIYSGSEDGNQYLNSIKIVNEKIIDLVSYIINNDKNSIILLQSDHGPTYVGNQNNKDSYYWLYNSNNLRPVDRRDCKYTFGILSAVYFSPYIQVSEEMKEYFRGQLSLVNVFRSIFAWLSDVQATLLPDVSYFLYYDDNYKSYTKHSIDNLCGV
jgi:hypothetical protein